MVGVEMPVDDDPRVFVLSFLLYFVNVNIVTIKVTPCIMPFLEGRKCGPQYLRTSFERCKTGPK